MKKINSGKVLLWIASLFLAGYMVYGGVSKFLVDAITAPEVLAKATKFNAPEQINILQKILYISGSKQTGYFRQLLRICELLFGLLIINPHTRLIGAIREKERLSQLIIKPRLPRAIMV